MGFYAIFSDHARRILLTISLYPSLTIVKELNLRPIASISLVNKKNIHNLNDLLLFNLTCKIMQNKWYRTKLLQWGHIRDQRKRERILRKKENKISSYLSKANVAHETSRTIKTLVGPMRQAITIRGQKFFLSNNKIRPFNLLASMPVKSRLVVTWIQRVALYDPLVLDDISQCFYDGFLILFTKLQLLQGHMGYHDPILLDRSHSMLLAIFFLFIFNQSI